MKTTWGGSDDGRSCSMTVTQIVASAEQYDLTGVFDRHVVRISAAVAGSTVTAATSASLSSFSSAATATCQEPVWERCSRR